MINDSEMVRLEAVSQDLTKWFPPNVESGKCVLTALQQICPIPIYLSVLGAMNCWYNLYILKGFFIHSVLYTPKELLGVM